MTAINKPKINTHGIKVITNATPIFCVILPPHVLIIVEAFNANCVNIINMKYIAKRSKLVLV